MTLVWTPGWNGLTEPEAVSYVAAVEAADGQPLEFATAKAINDFVLGCKNDGIWNAIKASCILAGARTRLGALTPLVGAAPTSFNFIDANYDRKTGLVGDGSTKYLDSNRNNNADPQDSRHLAVFTKTTSFNSSNRVSWIGSVSSPLNLVDHDGSGGTAVRGFSTSNTPVIGSNLTGIGGFAGVSRATSAECTVRGASVSTTGASGSSAPNGDDILLFARSNSGVPQAYSNIRLAFYSIGESLDLALLDTRVTDLITAFGAVIP